MDGGVGLSYGGQVAPTIRRKMSMAPLSTLVCESPARVRRWPALSAVANFLLR
jgi:hypothetical protein